MAADKLLLRGRVIHVNEDGWVVLNLGAYQGVQPGQRFAVLGERRPRQIRDPFALASPHNARQPVLWVDTAYELLRVILVEHQCCVAISDRVPLERTPQPYLGPQGELLLYTPPPADWRYDAFELEEASQEDEALEHDPSQEEREETSEASEEEALAAQRDQPGKNTASQTAQTEAPPPEEDPAEIIARQQEHLWDGSLPLNAVQVGDEVILAQPYSPGPSDRLQTRPGLVLEQSKAAPTPAPGNLAPGSDLILPTTTYDWMKPS